VGTGIGPITTAGKVTRRDAGLRGFRERRLFPAAVTVASQTVNSRELDFVGRLKIISL
ncbi:MAG: hypothetical protein HC767_09620, partial [Akkermansiaceae bacterium]|nr:hypothetical protein [Akkermansiaceae bacterium]